MPRLHGQALPWQRQTRQITTRVFVEASGRGDGGVGVGTVGRRASTGTGSAPQAVSPRQKETKEYRGAAHGKGFSTSRFVDNEALATTPKISGAEKQSSPVKAWHLALVAFPAVGEPLGPPHDPSSHAIVYPWQSWTTTMILETPTSPSQSSSPLVVLSTASSCPSGPLRPLPGQMRFGE